MIEGASEVPGHADRGLGTTAQQLAQTWKAISGPRDVVEFYGHGRHARQFACFSNFYDQRDDPFWFSVSNQLDCKVELPEDRRRVSCAFSEKAIMLCKAAVMGDVQTYVEICEARRPHQAKTLGRRVQNFNGTLWDRVVCHVAFHVVYEKFRQSPAMRSVLLGTGDRLIAEATARDKIWGIGIDVGDPRARDPSAWCGTNILGWALMGARRALREEGALAPARGLGRGDLFGGLAPRAPTGAERPGLSGEAPAPAQPRARAEPYGGGGGRRREKARPVAGAEQAASGGHAQRGVVERARPERAAGDGPRGAGGPGAVADVADVDAPSSGSGAGAGGAGPVAVGGRRGEAGAPDGSKTSGGSGTAARPAS